MTGAPMEGTGPGRSRDDLASPAAVTDETPHGTSIGLLTEREVRVIKLYADVISDQALGLAAQHAAFDHGTDADRSYSAIHLVLRELRKEGYRQPLR